MPMNVKTHHNTLIVKIKGELDHHTAEEIRNELDNELANRSIKNLLFDFSDLHFMDSSGIGVLMGRYKKIAQRKGQAGIYQINPQVRRIFEISGLSRIFKEFKNFDEAIEKI